LICPKCGFEQPAGRECARCGVVYEKYRARGGSLPAPVAYGDLAAAPLDASALPAGLPALPEGTLYGGEAAPFDSVAPPHAGPGVPAIPGAATIADQQRIKQLLKTQWTFSQEELLRDTLTIFANNVVAFSVVALLVQVPETYLLRYFQGRLLSAGTLPSPWWIGAALVASLLMVPLATSAFVYGVLQEMRGLKPSIVKCLVTGIGSLVRVLLVSILLGIALFCGMLLCFLPGLILLLTFYVAVPAAVEERLGSIGALRRSAELTHGFRLHIFYVLTKLAVAQFVLSFVVRLILLLAGVQPSVRDTFTYVISALFLGLGATATAVAYYRLRMVKDGVSAAEMVAVFD